jgi:RHH-type proline utilization regulon transcriptional repressor/proline dehydrogenase/delta 1-pyrroline-5-carboxylate dehydrogenase
LPGPTGERNTWRLVPRDAVLCLGGSRAAFLMQLAVALGTGADAAWLAADADLAALGHELPEAVRVRLRAIADPLDGRFDAALIGAGDRRIGDWSERLAARAGPIVALHVLDADPAQAAAFPLERLMVERTLSINTAAAGGNASLMTIG